MRELDVSGNPILCQLSDIIGSLRSLKTLFLRRCKMSGAIAVSVLNHTRLSELDLSHNSLELQIPHGFADLIPWTSFIVQGNDAKTKQNFPSWLVNLTQLVHLDLLFSSLSGPLPSYNITRLQKLKYLDLSDNSLSGEIPSWVFDLPLLEELSLERNDFKGELHEFRFTNSHRSIRLSSNELTGSLLQSILRQSNLHYLDLSHDKFNVIVEMEKVLTLTKLEILLLAYNQIHGLFPDWVCISSRIVLLLPGNNFSGALPHCHGNLGVIHLDLSMNNFCGTIPSTFTNLSKLWHLDLYGNQMEGNMPNLRNCTSLQVLDLGRNKLKDTFPHCLKRLPGLNFVSLSTNEFHGSILIPNISRSEDPFPSLRVMHLSNYGFKGEIPNALINLSFLQVLDLHNNDFQGSIPSFRGFNLLETLNLRGNRLQGAIPSSLKNCLNLEVIDVGKNQIEDTFPSWLGTLPNLQVLVMSYNRFHDPINTNSITETPFPNLRIVDLSCNNFSGTLPELFFKNFQAMEYVDANNKEITYMSGYERSDF